MQIYALDYIYQKMGIDPGDIVYFMIDDSARFQNCIPQELLEKVTVLTQIEDRLSSAEKSYELASARNELLRDTACLVITDRYPIAAPCCAMGIPVIMVCNENGLYDWTFDQRLSALNPHIPFYTLEQWDEMDWTPQSTAYEDTKQEIILKKT